MLALLRRRDSSRYFARRRVFYALRRLLIVDFRSDGRGGADPIAGVLFGLFALLAVMWFYDQGSFLAAGGSLFFLVVGLFYLVWEN